MSEGYSQILSKKSQIEAHFKQFTKNFQKQLAFIELKVRQDAAKLSKIATCCFVLCSNIKDRSQLISVEQKKLNKPFFLVFQLMTVRERQFYFLELLSMIGSLVEAYNRKFDTTKKDLDHVYLKQLREQLADQLQDIHIDNTISLKRPSLSKQNFYVRTICDGVAAEKNLKVDRCLLLLIEHMDKRQLIKRIDVRNYLLLNESAEQQVYFTLRSIFEGEAPYTIKILFLEEEEKRILEYYLIEIVKIGKIQRLVSNLDMERHVLGDKMGQPVERKDIFSNSMLSINNDPQITFDADNIKSSLSPRYVKKSIRRQETQIQYFNELKTTIVRALNELAIKKTAQNQRIKKFKRQALSGSKRRSQQLIDAANNQQARIVKVRQKESLENEGEEVVNETILRIAGFKSHVIVTPNKINRADTFRSEDEDSFRDDDRNKQLKKNVPIFFSPNIYSTMYPDHRMRLLTGLGEYHEIELKRIWINLKLSETITTRQQLQKEVLIENVRVYGHKRESNKFKVIINIVADLKGLIMTLANLEVWPLWHPNITKIDILKRNHSENSYEILLSCNKNKVSFQICLKVHLFKVDNRYFMVMKSLQNPEEEVKRSSLLSFLGFGSKTDLIYDYLLLTIQTYGSKGNSVQIIADFELNHSALKKKPQIKLEQMTFLINFYFITAYWKIDWNQHDRFDSIPSSCMFDMTWKVESAQFVEVPSFPDSGKILW